MKAKALWIAVLAGIIVAVSAPAQEFGTMEQTRSRKLGRGMTNILFSWLEIPKSMMAIDKTHGGAAAWTWGVFRGVNRTAMRIKTGVGEIRYFWQPSAPSILPEFPLMPESQYASVEWERQAVEPPERDKLDLLTRRVLGLDESEQVIEADEAADADAMQRNADEDDIEAAAGETGGATAE